MPITITLSSLNVDSSANNLVYAVATLAFSGNYPTGGDTTNSKPSAKTLEPSAVIPAGDLKPLYDFTLDCKACQARLAAAQADLIDERAKAAVLARERDEAVPAAKGGSLLRRIARNAKWLAIGAAAGAIAAKAHP